MTLANLQRSLGFILALSAIGFLAILAYPSDRPEKQVATAEIQHSLESAAPAQ